MRLWITHFTQLGPQLGWSLSLQLVPWLYKLSCTESRRFNSYIFFSFFKFWCLTAAVAGTTAKLSSHQVFITRPGLFFISLSLFLYLRTYLFLPLCLSCLSLSLHPINAAAWLYKAHHDSINFLPFFPFSLFLFPLVSYFRMACIWIIYTLFTNNLSLSFK